MTAMPEMVSLFNGMGGACAALISVVEFNHLVHGLSADATMEEAAGFFATHKTMLLIILLGLIIGSISFAGSMMAWGKLNGKVKDFSFKGQHMLNNIAFPGDPWLSGYILIASPQQTVIFFYVIVASLTFYGVFFVMPIGGADMPVVISLLNSFTGVAAACGGFLYDNKVMLTGGILVGAAGTLLTILMCKAMNRSLDQCTDRILWRWS